MPRMGTNQVRRVVISGTARRANGAPRSAEIPDCLYCSNVRSYAMSGIADNVGVAQHYRDLSSDGLTVVTPYGTKCNCGSAFGCRGARGRRILGSLLQIDGYVADLRVGVEFENTHRVHDMRIVTEEVPLFDLEVYEF